MLGSGLIWFVRRPNSEMFWRHRKFVGFRTAGRSFILFIVYLMTLAVSQIISQWLSSHHAMAAKDTHTTTEELL
jgi:hypothetical protein